jgi:hypothetical protein
LYLRRKLEDRQVLTTSIGWVLIVSGIVTAGGGLVALLFPHFNLRSTYGDESPTSVSVFFVRHWGVLIIAVGGLIILSAYDPAIRVPILVAAAVEKFAIGLLVFFGPVKRTSGMTVVAIIDGIFALLFVGYLAGL